MLLIGKMMVICYKQLAILLKIGFGQQISIWNTFLKETTTGGL